MLYILNWYSAVCQLYLNKTGRKERISSHPSRPSLGPSEFGPVCCTGHRHTRISVRRCLFLLMKPILTSAMTRNNRTILQGQNELKNGALRRGCVWRWGAHLCALLLPKGPRDPQSLADLSSQGGAQSPWWQKLLAARGRESSENERLIWVAFSFILFQRMGRGRRLSDTDTDTRINTHTHTHTHTD